MKIILYENTSPKKKVVKKLTMAKELEGNLMNECSVVSPTVLVEIDNLSQYNYMYIPVFHRYYFITNSTVVQNKIWRIEAHTDVLMSSKDDLLKNQCVVEKVENGGSNYVDDGSWTVRADSFVQATQMSGDLGNYSTYLMVAGKPQGV